MVMEVNEKKDELNKDDLKDVYKRQVFMYQTMVSFMLQFVRTMIRKKWIHT